MGVTYLTINVKCDSGGVGFDDTVGIEVPLGVKWESSGLIHSSEIES